MMVPATSSPPRKRGPRGNRHSAGDLIVQVDVLVPEKLTEEQEKAMKEFADASGLKY